jgi:hypothetical protein
VNTQLTSAQLRKAADLQEKIETLQADLLALINGSTGSGTKPTSKAAPTGNDKSSAPEAKSPRRRRRSSLRGKSRPRSPSGPLGPAVISVLKKAGKPLRVPEILKGLESAKYVWTAKDPKTTLYARIYRLPGVKKVAEGRFTVA